MTELPAIALVAGLPPLPLLAAAAALLFVPGYAAAMLLLPAPRYRPLERLLAAPALTVALLALLTLWASVLFSLTRRSHSGEDYLQLHKKRRFSDCRRSV